MTTFLSERSGSEPTLVLCQGKFIRVSVRDIFRLNDSPAKFPFLLW